jgi:hypothetical protein
MRDQKRKIRNFRIRDFEVTDGKQLLGVRYMVQNEVHTILDDIFRFFNFILSWKSALIGNMSYLR